MAQTLKFRVEYVGKTPFHDNERIGNLTGYSTTYRYDDGFIMVPMTAGTGAHMPAPMQIEIPIHETGSGAVSLPHDAAVYIGAQSFKTNFEGRTDCADMFGAARVSVAEIKEAVAKSGKFSTKRAMTQNQVQIQLNDDSVTGYPRGEIKITLLNPDAVKRVSLLGATRYSCIGGNISRIEKTVDALAEKAMKPELKPIGDQAERINLPYLNDNETLPGFMVNYDTTVRGRYDEGYYLNLAHMALRAKGMDEKTFVRVAEKQFRNPAVNDPDFNLVCSVVAAAASMRSVHSVYRSDEAYVQDSGDSTPKKIGTESMGASENQGRSGDCEDLGFTNVRHGRAISFGRTEKADAQNYWSRDGGWESPLLQTMQRVASHFVFTIALTSVASTPKVEASSKNEMPVMGSKEDDYEIGAHMYGLMIPETTFATLVNRQCKGEIKLDTAKPALTPSVHILEGTGNVDSLYLPLGALYADDETAKKRVVYSEQMLKASKIVVRDDSLFTTASFEIKPPVTVDKEERRNTNFYRTITHIFTQDAHTKWGVNAFKFDAVTNASSQPLVGFDLRNLAVAAKANLPTFKHDNARWQSIGLLPVGRFSKDELAMLDNLARGTPPVRGGVLEPAAAASMFEWQWPNAPLSNGSASAPTTQQIIDDFQKCADAITKNRGQGVSKARIQLAWKCGDFFTGALERKGKDPLALRAGLLQEITENKCILAVNVRFEPIHATAREHPTYWHYTTVMDVDVAIDGPLPAAMKVACHKGEAHKKDKKSKKSHKKSKKSKPADTKYSSYRAHFKRSAAPLIAAHQPARVGGVMVGNVVPVVPVTMEVAAFIGLEGAVEEYVKVVVKESKRGVKGASPNYEAINSQISGAITEQMNAMLLEQLSESKKGSQNPGKFLKLMSYLIISFVPWALKEMDNFYKSTVLDNFKGLAPNYLTAEKKIGALPSIKGFLGINTAKRVVDDFKDKVIKEFMHLSDALPASEEIHESPAYIKAFAYANKRGATIASMLKNLSKKEKGDPNYFTVFELILFYMLRSIYNHRTVVSLYPDVQPFIRKYLGRVLKTNQ